MSAYWTDLLVFGGAFALACIAIYLHDRKPRRDVLPPPSKNCRRDYA